MPRIPLPTVEELTPEQRRVYDAVVAGPRGVVRRPAARRAAQRPELADKWQQLGELLRYRTSLPPRLTELAILVTARHWDCQLEWLAHEPPALKGGVPQAVIDAIRHGRRPKFDHEDEEAVYEYAAQLNATHFVTDTAHKRARDLLGVVGVVELTALVGYYGMVAATLNAHELLPPPDVPPPLPPRA